MNSIRVIPCLDVDSGRVVKGVNFVGLREAGDPVELAARYDADGADELIFLDITASSDQRETTIEMVRRTAEEVFIPFTVGGGVRTVEDARRLLRAGADKVGINTAAVDRPELISEIADEFGVQCVVVAIDARGRAQSIRPAQASSAESDRAANADAENGDAQERLGWEVFTHGGRTPVGLDAVQWAARAVELGAGEILLTSMDRDGTKEGFDLQLTAAVAAACSVPVIASGGVGTLDHLVQGVVLGHADAVLAASIFHFGEFTVGQAKHALTAAGVTVRPA